MHIPEREMWMAVPESLITPVSDLIKTYKQYRDELERPENWNRFRELWRRGASEREFYELAKALGYEGYFIDFQEAWDHRNILAGDIETAKTEFLYALIGYY